MQASEKELLGIHAVLCGANEAVYDGDSALARGLPSEVLEIAKVLRDFILDTEIDFPRCEYYLAIPTSDNDPIRLRENPDLLMVIKKLGHDFKIEPRWTWGRYLHACTIQTHWRQKKTDVWRNAYMGKVNKIANNAKVEATKNLIASFEAKYGEIVREVS